MPLSPDFTLSAFYYITYKKIEVFTFKKNANLLSATPKNSEEAQYNISFPIASTIIFEKFSPDQFQEKQYNDSRIIDINTVPGNRMLKS